MATRLLDALLVLAIGAAALGCGSSGGSSGGGGGGGCQTPVLGVGPDEWYVGNTQGNPLKTHTMSEATLAADVLALVNVERANAGGLSPLSLDVVDAERAAKAHSEDMQDSVPTFFDHTTPECWDPGDRLFILGASGYSGWGENIAFGQATAADVMTAWMGSAGHRANILSSSHTHIGIGVAEGGTIHWTQVFLRRP